MGFRFRGSTSSPEGALRARPRFSWIPPAVLVTLLLGWPAGSAPQERVAPLLDGGETEKAAAPKYVPDHVLVRFRPGTPRAWQEGAHAGLKAQVLRRYRSVGNLALVRLPAGMSVEEAGKLYRLYPKLPHP